MRSTLPRAWRYRNSKCGSEDRLYGKGVDVLAPRRPVRAFWLDWAREALTAQLLALPPLL